MNMDLLKKAMVVGHLFWKKYQYDEKTYEWNASEECSLFCETIIKKAEINKCSIEGIFNEYAEELIDQINNIKTEVSCHMWDEYCKGFLAGEILGYPNEENMELVKEAEKLWENTDVYGYYQEVLNDVRLRCNLLDVSEFCQDGYEFH